MVRATLWQMTLPAPRTATYEDILALPEHVVGEIVDGELVVSPRPAVPHAMGTSALGATLVTRMQFGDGGPGGWWILDEPELHLGPHVVVPDIAGWRRERMPSPPRDAFITNTPDWLCEVPFARDRSLRPDSQASALRTSRHSAFVVARSEP
jgi:hypothetical protein